MIYNGKNIKQNGTKITISIYVRQLFANTEEVQPVSDSTYNFAVQMLTLVIIFRCW